VLYEQFESIPQTDCRLLQLDIFRIGFYSAHDLYYRGQTTTTTTTTTTTIVIIIIIIIPI